MLPMDCAGPRKKKGLSEEEARSRFSVGDKDGLLGSHAEAIVGV